MDLDKAFLDAAYLGESERVGELLDAEPGLIDVAGPDGKTALHMAAESDQPGVALVLLDRGADIEARASWGASAFDWAATVGSSRVGELLLSRGASGLTLITAASFGMADMVAGALERGGPFDRHRRRDAPHEPDRYWPSDSAHLLGDVLGDALYAAARNGHTEVVRLLAAAGASVDAKGVFGGTGLHWAAIHGRADTVELLLSLGADRELLDVRFEASPAGWAEEGGHARLAERIRGTA